MDGHRVCCDRTMTSSPDTVAKSVALVGLHHCGQTSEGWIVARSTKISAVAPDPLGR